MVEVNRGLALSNSSRYSSMDKRSGVMAGVHMELVRPTCIQEEGKRLCKIRVQRSWQRSTETRHCQSLPDIAAWPCEWCHGRSSDGACTIWKGLGKIEFKGHGRGQQRPDIVKVFQTQQHQTCQWCHGRSSDGA